MRPAVPGKKPTCVFVLCGRKGKKWNGKKTKKTKSSALNPKSHEPEGEGVSQKRQHVSVRGAARGEPASFISLACCWGVFFGLQKESGGGGGKGRDGEMEVGEREEGTRRTKLK